MLWLEIDERCEHCGRRLEAAYDYNCTRMLIKGYYPMRYRHAETHESECVITTVSKVRPYTESRVAEKYDKAREEYYQDEQ